MSMTCKALYENARANDKAWRQLHRALLGYESYRAILRNTQRKVGLRRRVMMWVGMVKSPCVGCRRHMPSLERMPHLRLVLCPWCLPRYVMTYGEVRWRFGLKLDPARSTCDKVGKKIYFNKAEVLRLVNQG